MNPLRYSIKLNPPLWILLLVFFLASCQTSPKKIVSIRHLTANDETYLKTLRSEPGPKAALSPNIGYLLYDPIIKEILDSSNEHLPFIPASTTKVLTSVVALRVLGPQ